MTEPVIGIDLGTTLSVVAWLDNNGTPKTIPNEEGELVTPSVVFFDTSETIVGREAVKAAEFDPQLVATFAKRNMGDDAYEKEIGGCHFPPEVIQALVLRKLKRDAEAKLGPISKAVITVPAYFTEPRRKATQDAGRLAGLDVIDIINEPTAAAIAYGVEQGFLTVDGKTKQSERVLVYDLGGGTFDVTLMEISSGQFNAIATAGDVHLGGIDWDERLAAHLAGQFSNEHGVDLTEDLAGWEKLLRLAADTKYSLTARDQAPVAVAHEGQSVRLKISRAEFEDLTADLLDRTRLTVKRMMKEAGMSWDDITRLLLVGGSSRMPMVRSMLEKESGKVADRSLSLDEAVAHGAAIYAAILARDGPSQAPDSFSVGNVSSHHLGVLGLDPKTQQQQRGIMIPRNTPLPATKSRSFETFRDGQQSVTVSVVEGGTDTGEGATPIGKCVVRDLPAGLPRGTQVRVQFQYRGDGRLEVAADLPAAKRGARMTIERNAGMSEEDIADWTELLADGFNLDDFGDPADLSNEELDAILDENDDEIQQVIPAKDNAEGEEPRGDDAGLDDFLKNMDS